MTSLNLKQGVVGVNSMIEIKIPKLPRKENTSKKTTTLSLKINKQAKIYDDIQLFINKDDNIQK